MLLPMQVCFGAASPLCGGQELVSTVDVCVSVLSSSAGRGSPGWGLLHYFLWDFLPCTVVRVRPPVINVKAAPETKELRRRSNNLRLFISVETPPPPDYLQHCH